MVESSSTMFTIKGLFGSHQFWKVIEPGGTPKPPSIESCESVELRTSGEPRVAAIPGLEVSKIMKRFCSPRGAVDPGIGVVYGVALGDTAADWITHCDGGVYANVHVSIF